MQDSVSAHTPGPRWGSHGSASLTSGPGLSEHVPCGALLGSWEQKGQMVQQHSGLSELLSGVAEVSSAKFSLAEAVTWLCLSSVNWDYGNPLQYSCLENPVDRGAWWVAVYEVAQSRTRLKRLSVHALEREMATHSSILACRIPGTEEPGGLPSMRSHRVGHD